MVPEIAGTLFLKIKWVAHLRSDSSLRWASEKVFKKDYQTIVKCLFYPHKKCEV